MVELTVELLDRMFIKHHNRLLKLSRKKRQQEGEVEDTIHDYYISLRNRLTRERIFKEDEEGIKDFVLGIFSKIHLYDKVYIVNDSGKISKRKKDIEVLCRDEHDENAYKYSRVEPDNPETILTRNQNKLNINKVLTEFKTTSPKRCAAIIDWAINDLDHASKEHENVITNAKSARMLLRKILNPDMYDLSAYTSREDTIYARHGRPSIDKKCTHPGCNEKHRAKGLCHRHYALTDDQRRKRGEKVPTVSNNTGL